MSEALSFAQVKLASLQGFLGALAFGNIHGDADVLAWFSGWIAMSDRTQESDAAVGMMNPIFVEVKIRLLADCSFQGCIHTRCVFRVLSIEKAFGGYRA